MSYSDPREQHGSMFKARQPGDFTSRKPGKFTPRRTRHEPLSAAARGVLIVQMVFCGAVLFVVGVGIGLEYAAGSYDGGLSAIGYSFSSAFAAGIATLAALAIGLPLRRRPEVRHWWMRRWYVSWLVVCAGALLMFLAYNAGFAGWRHYPGDAGVPPYDHYEPDWWILLVGLGVLTLGLAHFWLPVRRKEGATADGA